MSKISFLAVLGSGGHTAEMLKLVEAFSDDNYFPKTFVYAKTDIVTQDKLKNKVNETFEVNCLGKPKLKRSLICKNLKELQTNYIPFMGFVTT